ncbi:CHAT domain-containing protein [Nonomuraea sp. NPDC050451]|uniref:CHAT domain-containing protein n=1 Tax=Nonomuraea sp. NPDC050451 TaxID=3364364 RepID=UPI0037AC331E
MTTEEPSVEELWWRLAQTLARVPETGLESVLDPELAQVVAALAAALDPADPDLRALYAIGYWHWYRHLAQPPADAGDPTDLRQAITYLYHCYREGVPHEQLPPALLPVFAELDAEREEADLSGDADAAVQAWRDRLADLRPGSPAWVHAMARLGEALLGRFGQLGTPRDVDEAIAVLRAAEAASDLDDAEGRSALLTNLGVALAQRFDRSWTGDDLDEAITAFRRSAELSEGQARVTAVSGLSNALHLRFQVGGDLSDLDGAIRLGREAVADIADDAPDRAGVLSNLGAILQKRFERLGEALDLDEAVSLLGESVRAVTADDPRRAMHLSNYGIALLSRFEWFNDLEDLEAAVRAQREALELTPAEHPSRSTTLINLATALHLRYLRTGSIDDLEQSIGMLEEAVRALPEGHPAQAFALANLGGMLTLRFERTRTRAHVDAAVDRLREAVAATPADNQYLPGRLANLGNALHSRHDLTGALEDLEEAVRRQREALELTSADDPDLVERLTNLGSALLSRHQRLDDQEDLDRAITCFRQAVEVTPPGHAHRMTYLSNLGGALYDRFRLLGEHGDLEEADHWLQEAVEATPEGHSGRGSYLTNRGVVQHQLFLTTSDPQALEQAVDIHRQALALLPENHPVQMICLRNLADALRSRHELTGSRDDLGEAIGHLRTVAASDLATPSERVMTGRLAGTMAVETNPGLAARLLANAVRLLHETVPRELVRGDQQHALSGHSGLTQDAVALALRDEADPDAPSLALGLLEAGRAVLLGQALETREELTELDAAHPDLAERISRLRDSLDDPGELTGLERRELAEQWRAALAEVRALPGFSAFALPPSVDELVREAAHGALVAFNVSQYGSHALIVTPSGIDALALPGLAFATVVDQVVAFYDALAATMTAPERDARIAAQRTIGEVLAWLWEHAMHPVLEHLGHGPVLDEAWPRVWWLPGGLLGLLPLHAAGRDGDFVLDRVVSSYSPTVRALRHARRHASPVTGPALLVAMSETPGVPGRLHHVKSEVEQIAARLPGSKVLDDPPPTGDTVREQLSRYPVAHFACHGTCDPLDPSHSRLLLHDQPLTVSALATLRLDRVRLAYLSACETSLSLDITLLDEAIHLASAFQAAGYPHVVGTLWTINDKIAADIATDFYDRLSMGPALALHHAVRGVRTRFPSVPSLWSAHLHSGA